MFLEKLRAHGWLELFTNTQMGCSQPELAEFYARVVVTEGIVTSEVNGVTISFDAKRLGEILGIPSVGFDVCPGRTKQCWEGQNCWSLPKH